MKSFAFLSLSIMMASPTAAQKQKLPVIDMHLHALTLQFTGGQVVPNPATGQYSAANTNEAVLAVTLAQMEQYNVVKAITSGPLSIVYEWAEVMPDRIIAGPLFGGSEPDPELKVSALRAAYLDGRLGAMGELTNEYEGIPANDPRLEPYFALAEELDIPVGVHTGVGMPNAPYTCCPDFRVRLGDPLLLEDVLVRHPKLRLFLMHAGYPYLENTKALMLIHQQVYAGLGAISWVIPRAEFDEYLTALVQAGLGERLMFGSDQVVWPEAIGIAIERIQSADFLTHDQKRGILYDNAARFLRLSEQEVSEHHRN